MLHRNRSTALFATVQGVAVGALGAIHGISAALKGFVPTDGFVMATVGAVTIIPNYLITGTAAIVLALCIVLWTVFFVHRERDRLSFCSFRYSSWLLAVGLRTFRSS